MRARMSLIAVPIVALSVVSANSPAWAVCKTMGFIVNDYGKDGPTKDAKDLLDKEIAKWAAANNVAKYSVGKKDVKCELFLDVLLFDEHTCTAKATLCWNEAGGAPPKAPDAAAPSDEAAKPKEPAKKAAKAPAKESEGQKAPVETGAIKDVSEKPAAETATAPAAASQADAAERAAAAAERAAAAAERAAAAAEAAKAASAPPSAEASAIPAPAASSDSARQIAPASESAAKP